MILSKRTVVRKSNILYKELDNLCFLSKNLYNATLYVARQSFIDSKYKNYNAINKEFTLNKQIDYISLPAKVSKQTQMLVDRNFKSFFKLLEKKNKGNYDKDISIPKYLHKTKGRQVVIYTKDALSFKRKGYVKLSKSDIYIKCDLTKDEVRQLRLVPKGNHIVIEILYKVEEKSYVVNDNYASIDLGINNLATITSNKFNPLIINGKPLKSINRFYNKKIAKEQSKLGLKLHTSSKIKGLWLRRKNKIEDYLHKSSSYIVNQLVSNDISNLLIGYNKGWKQDINIGKVNNQKFVMIPYHTFIQMLEYKCKVKGIKVEIQEESYTSKVSFIDNEEIKKHSKYKGSRIKRGLFKTEKGLKLNADVNGSLNILKKYLIKNNKWNEDLHLELSNNVLKIKKVVFNE